MIADTSAKTPDHVVQFYVDEPDLVRGVDGYLSPAMREGAAAVIVATAPHRRAFEERLTASGIDVAGARAAGRLVALDAAETLAGIARPDGSMDRDAMFDLLGGVVRRAAENGRPVRVYGEMVALLWEAGRVPAAIELERLWNELARDAPFSLYCSYPAASVAGDEHRDSLQRICELHSAVAHGPHGTASDLQQGDVSVHLTADPKALRRARRLVGTALEGLGHLDTFAEDAVLVVSELAANAVLHAKTSFSLTVSADGPRVRIAVADFRPLAGEEEMVARMPHGLGVVDALAGRWGVDTLPHGKVVWAELSR